MDELVRVRIKLGGKVRLHSMGRALAEVSDNVEILEGEPARGRNGRVLPDTFESGRPLKPHTSVAEEAAKKKPAAEAAGDPTSEES